jgi:hypothetical protein
MRASTKEDAVIMAQRLAGGVRTSMIIVYDADGGIERRIEYGAEGS